MSHHRAQAQFDRAKWRRSILFTTWTLQIIVMAVLAVLFGWRLKESMGNDARTVSIVWEVTNIALPGGAFMLTAYEIYRYSRKTLTPWTMLFTNTIKCTCSIGALVLDVYVYVVQDPGYYYAVSGLVLDSLFIFFTLVPATYSIRTYNRSVTLDEHLIASNTKSFGFANRPTDLGSQHRYSDSFSSQEATIVHGTPQRKSVSSLTSLSTPTSSVRSVSDTTAADSQVSRVSGSPPPESVTASVSSGSTGTAPPRSPVLSPYKHERDTQFDEYIAKRASLLHQPPPKSPRRSSISSSLTPLTVNPIEDKLLRSPPNSPPGRSIVPSVVISPVGMSGTRRISAGLDVVMEEVEGNRNEEEEETEKKGLLCGKAERELQVKKTRKQQRMENEGLLMEVDLNAEDTGISRKRGWDGTAKP